DSQEELEAVSESLDIPPKELEHKVKLLKEVNPMLGHRGCRLGITYPEITAMQSWAIMEAAIELKEDLKAIEPEIMIPLVSTAEEFYEQKAVIDETANKVFEEKGAKIINKVGTRSEVTRSEQVAE